MGNWAIVVRGTGCHHNYSKAVKDANRTAAEFVKQIKADGHTVSSATFTVGHDEDISGADEYLAGLERAETAAEEAKGKPA